MFVAVARPLSVRDDPMAPGELAVPPGEDAPALPSVDLGAGGLAERNRVAHVTLPRLRVRMAQERGEASIPTERRPKPYAARSVVPVPA